MQTAICNSSSLRAPDTLYVFVIGLDRIVDFANYIYGILMRSRTAIDPDPWNSPKHARFKERALIHTAIYSATTAHLSPPTPPCLQTDSMNGPL